MDGKNPAAPTSDRGTNAEAISGPLRAATDDYQSVVPPSGRPILAPSLVTASPIVSPSGNGTASGSVTLPSTVTLPRKTRRPSTTAVRSAA